MLNKTIIYLFIFIFGAVFGIYSPDLFHGILDTKEKSGIVGLKILKESLLTFKLRCGDFPSEKIGLQALIQPQLDGCITESILPMIPKDPWDKDVLYIKSNLFVLVINSNNDLEYVFRSNEKI